MPIDQRLKENGYIESAFLHQGLPIKLIADICLCTEEEVEEHLRQALVDKEECVRKDALVRSLQMADAMVKEGKLKAEAIPLFLDTTLNLFKRALTPAEQEYALSLKPTAMGFDTEPE